MCLWRTQVKYGLAVPHQVKHTWSALRRDWWYNWKHDLTAMADPGYVPMIYSPKWVGDIEAMSPAETPQGPPETGDVEALSAAYPGRYWLVWNEPDREDQANLSPEQGVEAYAEIARRIGARARLIVGGTLLDKGGMAWLREFMARLEMDKLPAPHGLHVHLYGWKVDNAAWAAYVESLKAARALLPNGELWLTETGYLDGVDPEWTRDYWMKPLLQATPRLVHRLAWFCTYEDAPWRSGTFLLSAPEGDLSPLGRYWNEMVWTDRPFPVIRLDPRRPRATPTRPPALR